MKEINVHCNLYLKVEDGMDIEAALDSLLMHLDPDVDINIHDYELQDN